MTISAVGEINGKLMAINGVKKIGGHCWSQENVWLYLEEN